MADTEATEKRFSLAGSGDEDQAKMLRHIGRYLMPPGEGEPPSGP